MSDINWCQRNSYYTAMLDNISDQLGLNLDFALTICDGPASLAELSKLNSYLSSAVSDDTEKKNAWLHLYNYELSSKPIDLLTSPAGLKEILKDLNIE